MQPDKCDVQRAELASFAIYLLFCCGLRCPVLTRQILLTLYDVAVLQTCLTCLRTLACHVRAAANQQHAPGRSSESSLQRRPKIQFMMTTYSFSIQLLSHTACGIVVQLGWRRYHNSDRQLNVLESPQVGLTHVEREV